LKARRGSDRGSGCQNGNLVSKETDLTLRTFLGSQGMKKGDLSKFIEEAVRWRVFHRTAQDIKARNAEADPEELQALIEDARI
jgi:hypothetical protein